MNITEETLRLLMAMMVGGIIGVEREFSSKAAGFRTMMLICTGSTLFTILSMKLGINSPDRIAANILTGIGFIGAGVVFKDGANVRGLTTAATIWITAALGMAIGSGDYLMAGEGAMLTIMVLFLFEYFQNKMIMLHQKRSYKIIFHKDRLTAIEIEQQINALVLKCSRKTEMKKNEERYLYVDVIGSKKKIDAFNQYLLDMDAVIAFEA